jgi:GTP-binding protein
MNARFLRACQSVEDLPQPSLPEIAVAGRSNCGKSSLINVVTGQSKLAKTSSTPGRTRQIVYFEITPAGSPPFFLVDLPGYGYAKAPRTAQQAWAGLINWYIDHRETLTALLLLSDIRREPREEELNLLHWAAERGLTTLVVLTKADKVKKGQRFVAAQRAKKALDLAQRPLVFCVDDRQAVEELREALLGLASLVSDAGR